MLLANLSIGDIASIGSLTMLLGILVTFVVFVLLLFAISAIQKAIKMKLFVKEKPAPIVEDTEDDAKEHEMINNSSLVAAITAAISVVLQGEKKPVNKSKAGFVVKSIKRI